MSDTRWCPAVCALATALVVGGGLLVAGAHGQPARGALPAYAAGPPAGAMHVRPEMGGTPVRPEMGGTPARPATGAAVTPPTAGAAAAPPTAGVIANGGVAGGTVRPGEIAVATRPIRLRYTFDGGSNRPIVDTAGAHELWAVGQNGGTLDLVPQGRGLAVRFPARCTLLREGDCPRAILQGVRDDTLNPGRRSLTYGASVVMTRADLSDGANVMQKGYSVGGGSQFKLQVDHQQGHPSCVVTGQGQNIYIAEANVDIADGRWHDLRCTRTATRLTLAIGGTERASVGVPPTVSIANAEPLRVGGKGPNKGNDQFAGEVDNVFLTIF